REPVQRPLRRREQTRLGSQLRFQPDEPRAHAPHPSVRGLDRLISPQRDARAHRKSEALILKLELGAERASGGPRAPVLRPFTRSALQKPSVGPRVVAVAPAHPQPRPFLLSP